jgi:hypothetical protein
VTDRLPDPDRAPNDAVPALLRSTSELVAWVATPWALAAFSPLLAIVVAVLLICLSSLFGTAGDRGYSAPAIVAVPGAATIGSVILQFAAAVVSAWYLTAWLGVPVLLLVAAAAAAELPRWRWLRRH